MFQEQSAYHGVNFIDRSINSMLALNGGYVRGRLTLVMLVMFFGAVSSPAQSPVQLHGDEKEPELRKELMRMVKEDQDSRGVYDTFRKEHGLMVNNKTLNEKLNSDPALKEASLAAGRRMLEGDYKRTLRLKEIVATHGWPGRSLVGYEASGAAYFAHSSCRERSSNGCPRSGFSKAQPRSNEQDATV